MRKQQFKFAESKRRRIVSEYLDTGRTAKQIAAKHGIGVDTLWRWRREFAEVAPETATATATATVMRVRE
jgi:transposase-like protein